MATVPTARTRAPERALRPQTLAAATIVLVALSAMIVLARVDPARAGSFPPCPFHGLTGLYCPGCGSLRCLHALLQGRFGQAAAWNPLAVLCLGPLMVWGANDLWRLHAGRPFIRRRVPAWSIRALFISIVLFWILRNLPHWPFSLLAPHVR